MSVLKYKRSESKVQFIYTAARIYKETIHYLSRLSRRYQQLLSPPAIQLASDLLKYVNIANEYFPNTANNKSERANCLRKARGVLSSLDTELSTVAEILLMNPSGCFEKESGELMSADKARNRLNKMSESLGVLIDEEMSLLTKILKSDADR